MLQFVKGGLVEQQMKTGYMLLRMAANAPNLLIDDAKRDASACQAEQLGAAKMRAFHNRQHARMAVRFECKFEAARMANARAVRAFADELRRLCGGALFFREFTCPCGRAMV